MLTETDRAEIAALVEEALAGRGQGDVTARRAVPIRRPVRLGRAETPEAGEQSTFSPSDGLAELGRSLAELRGELAQRLEYEAQEREKLSRRIHQMLEQPRGGGQGQVEGVPPVQGQEGTQGESQQHAGSALAGGGSKPAGGQTGQSQWADPAQSSAQRSASQPGAGTGGAQTQEIAYQGTAQKLAQANFDLAEALNENLRNLKEIVDRSQELVARIENILRRQAKGRQGA